MIPYNTDAPLYHLPKATVGLIVLNVLLFLVVPRERVELDFPSAEARVEGVATAGEESDWQAESPLAHEQREVLAMALPTRGSASPGASLALEYGQGIKPWQWLTSLFMHAHFLHLLMNMLALWALGLVVEGKVGLLPFLGIYLGIGVSQSALEQLIMCIHCSGGSLGASAAIFGLLGVAVIWAPGNDFEVLTPFGFFGGTAEIPILMFGFFQFALEVLNVSLGQFGISAGILHLMGFALGIAVGLVWLTRGWVDCEGWDLLAVFQGGQGRDLERERLEREATELVNSTYRPRSETSVRLLKPLRLSSPMVASPLALPAKAERPHSALTPQQSSADELAACFTAASAAAIESRLLNQIEVGNHQEAVRLLIQLRSQGVVALPQPHLAKLIGDLLKGQDTSNAIPMLAEHIRRFAENRVTLQLNLAKILLQRQHPKKALQVLESIDAAAVDPQGTETLGALAAYAKYLLQADSQPTR